MALSFDGMTTTCETVANQMSEAPGFGRRLTQRVLSATTDSSK